MNLRSSPDIFAVDPPPLELVELADLVEVPLMLPPLVELAPDEPPLPPEALMPEPLVDDPDFPEEPEVEPLVEPLEPLEVLPVCCDLLDPDCEVLPLVEPDVPCARDPTLNPSATNAAASALCFIFKVVLLGVGLAT